MDEREEKDIMPEDVLDEIPDEPTLPEVALDEIPDEPTAAADEPTKEPTAASGKGNIFAIAIGLLIFFGLLFAMWQMHGGTAAQGILYAKENNLYYFDLKNEPYLLQEGISDGGFYSIAGSAWGAKQAEKGNFAYYPAQIQENGAFTLYRRDVSSPKGEAILIASDVVDYQISADGRAAAYLTMAGDAEPMQLCAFDGQESRVIEENLQWQQNLYELSADGNYLAYYDSYNMLRVQRLDADVPSVVLTDAAVMYGLAEEGRMLYFVSQSGEEYHIFAYDFQNDPILLAENATYMEIMPNGRDLLYCVSPEEKIPYGDIVVDDLAEADAALAEGDEGYEAKLLRDEIRAAMEKGEGIAPILQEAYVYTGGKSLLVAEDVVSVMGVENDAPFVAGYHIAAPEPIALSLIEGGLETVEMYYYLTLSYSSLETFLADANGSFEILTGTQIPPETIQIAANGKKAAYLATDVNMGGNILMEMEIGKAADAAAVTTDIECFAFLGEDALLCSVSSENGTNRLQAGEKCVEDVAAVKFDTEAGVVYFLANSDATTGLGVMQSWNGKDAVQTINNGIFAYRNMGGGRLALLGNYHAESGLGDLQYFDGNGVQTLDADISSVFME